MNFFRNRSIVRHTVAQNYLFLSFDRAHHVSPVRYNFLSIFVGLTVSLSAGTTLVWYYVLDPALATQQNSESEVHPTSIPWLQSKEDCQKTGRLWRDSACWDYEHNPDF
jgi:hypothetical protein